MLALWFLMPLLSINNERPLAGVGFRLVIIFVLFFLWVVKKIIFHFVLLKADKKILHSILENRFPDIDDKSAKLKVAQLMSQYDKNFSIFKPGIFQSKRRNFISSLPWYIVVGAPASGKTSIIKNSGLDFRFNSFIGNKAQKLENTKNCDWFISDKAIFLDISRFEKNTQTDVSDWKTKANDAAWIGVLNYLRKYRRGISIKGIVLTIDLGLLYSNDRMRVIEAQTAARQRVTELVDILKIRVPTYILITKSDLMPGFTEFFSTFKEEETFAPLGITMSEKKYANFQEAFMNRYETLINALNKQVCYRLTKEDSEKKRSLMLLLVPQLKLLKQKIMKVFEPVLSDPYLADKSVVRGVFFTSVIQEGIPDYAIIDAIDRQFHLKSKHDPVVNAPNRTFFIKDLFRDVIFPDSQSLDSKLRKYQKFKNKLGSLKYVFPFLLVLTIALLFSYSAYSYNNYVKNIRSLINDYDVQQKINKKIKKRSLVSTINDLSVLDMAYQKKPSDALPWYNVYRYATSDSLRNALNDLLQRQILALYLPYVKSKLNRVLHQKKYNSSATEYLIFDLYMDSRSTKNFNSSLIRVLLSQYWSKKFTYNEELQNKLNHFLELLLQMNNPQVTQLTNDSRLKKLVYSRLKKYPLDQLIYYTIKHKIDQKYRDSGINRELPKPMRDFFNTSNFTMPVLFTPKGHRLYEINLLKILDDLSKNKSNILSIFKINPNEATYQKTVSGINKLYMKDYYDHWDSWIKNFVIRQPIGLQDYVSILKQLSKMVPSVPKLVSIILKNTEVTISSIDIQDHYENLRKLSSKKSDLLEQYKTKLSNAEKFFVTLQNASSDQNKLSYDILKAAFSGSKKASPISDLFSIGATLPMPLAQWTQELGVDSLTVIDSLTADYINAQWNQNVISKYNKLRSLYPLDAYGNRELDLLSFQDLFSESSSVGDFIKNFVSPFFDTTSNKLTPKKLHNTSLSFLPNSDKFIHKIQSISSSYFTGASGALGLNFYIKPIFLDNGSKSVEIDFVDKSSIRYLHGPQYYYPIKWPNTSIVQPLQVSFLDFNNNRETITFYGPWSIFKLMIAGKIHQKSVGSDRYFFKIVKGGHKAVFEVMPSGALSLSTLRLEKLLNVKFPDRLLE